MRRHRGGRPSRREDVVAEVADLVAVGARAGATPREALLLAVSARGSGIGLSAMESAGCWRPQGESSWSEVTQALRRAGASEDGVAAFTRAWRLSLEHGAPLAHMLGRLAHARRRRRDADLAREAAVAGPRASMVLLALLPLAGPLLAALLGLSMTVVYGSPIAWASASAGALLGAAGWTWGRVIVRRAARPVRVDSGSNDRASSWPNRRPAPVPGRPRRTGGRRFTARMSAARSPAPRQGRLAARRRRTRRRSGSVSLGRAWWRVARHRSSRSSLRWSMRRAPEPRGYSAHDVAETLDVLSALIRTGAAPEDVLLSVADASDDAVRADLRVVAAGYAWGLGAETAWAQLPPVWRSAGAAWQAAARLGAGPADLLEHAADVVRVEESRRIELAGAQAAVRLVLPLGLALLPAFVLTTVIPIVATLVTPAI